MNELWYKLGDTEWEDLLSHLKNEGIVGETITLEQFTEAAQEVLPPGTPDPCNDPR